MKVCIWLGLICCTCIHFTQYYKQYKSVAERVISGLILTDVAAVIMNWLLHTVAFLVMSGLVLSEMAVVVMRKLPLSGMMVA